MLVIDASVATKLLALEPGTTDARALLERGEPLTAPDWILAEVSNALFGKWRRGEMSKPAVTGALAILPDFFQTLYPTPSLLEASYRLMFQLDHAVYDCLYLAVALQEGGCLVTADAKFHGKLTAADLGRHAKLLGAGA